MGEFESLRATYKPDVIRTLFIGESVPAGGTFFYCQNSNLFNATRRAFSEATKREFEAGGEFLNFFKSQGLYLDDLVAEPVNQMNAQERHALRNASVPMLAGRLKNYLPRTIVIMMCAIEPMVLRAIREADVTCETHCTPFPAFGNQRRFHEAMLGIIPQLAVKEN